MMLAMLFLFLLGLCVGSFLNVCIHRMPEGISVILPSSHCPQCKRKIAWRDNIPLWSYLRLRGKCRGCGVKISWRYPAVELLSGLLWVFLGWYYGLTWMFAVSVVFFSILLAVIVTDFETGLIPDALTIPGMALGLIFAALYPPLLERVSVWEALQVSLLGLLGGGAILWLTAWLGEMIFRKESMGGGDIKLMAMMGSFLGLQAVCLVYFLAPVFALPVAVYAKFGKKAETIPYGPYLALAGMTMFLYGDAISAYFFGTGF